MPAPMVVFWCLTLCACVRGTACLLHPVMVQRQQGIRRILGRESQPCAQPQPRQPNKLRHGRGLGGTWKQNKPQCLQPGQRPVTNSCESPPGAPKRRSFVLKHLSPLSELRQKGLWETEEPAGTWETGQLTGWDEG